MQSHQPLANAVLKHALGEAIIRGTAADAALWHTFRQRVAGQQDATGKVLKEYVANPRGLAAVA
jgi:hypothetical protein